MSSERGEDRKHNDQVIVSLGLVSVNLVSPLNGSYQGPVM